MDIEHCVPPTRMLGHLSASAGDRDSGGRRAAKKEDEDTDGKDPEEKEAADSDAHASDV